MQHDGGCTNLGLTVSRTADLPFVSSIHRCAGRYVYVSEVWSAFDNDWGLLPLSLSNQTVDREGGVTL